MKNPYRSAVRPWLYTAAGSLAVAAALHPLGGVARVVAWLGGSMVALIAALCAASYWMYARNADRELAAFGRGEFLAHWRYAAAEWSAFAGDEWARVRKRAARMPLWCMLIGVLMGLVMMEAFGATGVVVCTVAAALIGWGIGRLWLAHGRRWFASPQASPELYIGPTCALLNGRHIVLSGVGVRVVEAKLADRALELTVRSGMGRSTSYHTHRIPVPAGRDDEARSVLASLGF